jgi:hypothetical protein
MKLQFPQAVRSQFHCIKPFPQDNIKGEPCARSYEASWSMVAVNMPAGSWCPRPAGTENAFRKDRAFVGG